MRNIKKTALIPLFMMVCISCGEVRTEKAVPETEQAVRPLPETGNCQNENVEGMCTFLVVFRAPGQSANDPPGTTLYRIQHQIAVKDEDRTIDIVSADLTIPNDKVEELRNYYREHSPTPCKAYIVRPPCNPQGTSVSLGIDPPVFAKQGRY